MDEHNKELEKINLAVAAYARAIIERMTEKFSEGYRGWDDEYPSEDLALELHGDTWELFKLTHKSKPHENLPVDIGARAMMLWHRRKHELEVADQQKRCPHCNIRLIVDYEHECTGCGNTVNASQQNKDSNT